MIKIIPRLLIRNSIKCLKMVWLIQINCYRSTWREYKFIYLSTYLFLIDPSSLTKWASTANDAIVRSNDFILIFDCLFMNLFNMAIEKIMMEHLTLFKIQKFWPKLNSSIYYHFKRRGNIGSQKWYIIK